MVIGTDDNSATQLGQIYVYVGKKQATGNEVEKAGCMVAFCMASGL